MATLSVVTPYRRALANSLHLPKPQSSTTGPVDVPLLLPLEPTTVELLTHTADFSLFAGEPLAENNQFSLQLTASYRLENGSAEPVAVILHVTEPATTSATATVQLLVEGIPQELFRTAGVGYTSQLQLGADSRTTVTLQYRVDDLETPLPLLTYPASILTRWPGAPSMRVSVTLPAPSGPESWLRIAPSGWRYQSSETTGLPGVKWLYDAQIPSDPFVFELIHPHAWQQLQDLEGQASTTPALYQEIGDRYRALLDAVPVDGTYDDVRTRFYSQALAAYTSGIDVLNAAGQTGNELGELYTHLASLYRTQVADRAGTINIAYSEAMVNAAQQALAQLPTTSSQRQELTQWVVDGLQLALAEAQANSQWSNALALVEQLAALPSDLVDHAILEQTKRSITVRQALQLLEEENRPAAFALAGAELADEALLPPQELRTPFSRWTISTTVTPDAMEITVEPLAFVRQHAMATTAIDGLVAAFKRSADSAITVEWSPAPLPTNEPARDGQASTVPVLEEQARPVGRLLIRAPSASSFASLTTAMPASAEWSFVYALLRQLQPTVERNRAWFNRRTTVRVLLDFQAVTAEWQGAATNLERQATALEEAAAARDMRDASEAEAALRGRIQAANYRAAAQQWRKLVTTSWLQLQIAVPSGIQQASRSWVITPETPASLAELTGSTGYLSAFISILVLGMAFLLLISSVLWWLL
ncbi:MAG: hypothetical protein KDE53_31125 [Caldilineaceae bacterium]|nr:hypothetical protein [Caldilineaceae bacterium]